MSLLSYAIESRYEIHNHDTCGCTVVVGCVAIKFPEYYHITLCIHLT